MTPTLNQDVMSKPIINRDGLETNDSWETPDWLYNELDLIFDFDHDPCPVDWTVDGLDYTKPWGSRNYVNPPYSRILKPKFIARCHNEWRHRGNTSVLLIPAATDTIDFHEIIYPGAAFGLYDKYVKDAVYRQELNRRNKLVLFFKGRISFKGYNTKGEYTDKNKGKHGSMLVILK